MDNATLVSILSAAGFTTRVDAIYGAMIKIESCDWYATNQRLHGALSAAQPGWVEICRNNISGWAAAETDGAEMVVFHADVLDGWILVSPDALVDNDEFGFTTQNYLIATENILADGTARLN